MTEQSTETFTPEVPVRKPLNKIVPAASAGLVVGIMLGIAGTLIATAAVAGAQAEAQAKAEAEKPRPLKAAVDSCRLGGSKNATLGDNGASLELDGMGKKGISGMTSKDRDCVLNAVNVPDFVRSRMENTRALDGTQRESWGSISATWTYHPDQGLDIVLTER